MEARTRRAGPVERGSRSAAGEGYGLVPDGGVGGAVFSGVAAGAGAPATEPAGVYCSGCLGAFFSFESCMRVLGWPTTSTFFACFFFFFGEASPHTG